MEQIRSREDLRTFLHQVCAFHDTCITEMRYCRLYPVQPEYTCEIFGAAMWMDDADRIYWCNDDGVTPETVDRYEGIAVCAASLEYEIQELRFEGRGNSNAT